MDKSQYSVIEDIFDNDPEDSGYKSTSNKEREHERERAYQSDLNMKNQNVYRERDQLDDKRRQQTTAMRKYNTETSQTTTPIVPEKMSCNSFYEHYLNCEFCRSYVERNEKFYQFVIFVLIIIIAILLRQKL